MKKIVKRVVKSKEELELLFKEDGYEFDGIRYDRVKEGKYSSFILEMYKYCGKEIELQVGEKDYDFWDIEGKYYYIEDWLVPLEEKEHVCKIIDMVLYDTDNATMLGEVPGESNIIRDVKDIIVYKGNENGLYFITYLYDYADIKERKIGEIDVRDAIRLLGNVMSDQEIAEYFKDDIKKA